MKWVRIAFVGLAVVGFLYSMINPAAIKKSSEIHYKALGFSEQPIWFWRILAATGFIGTLITLLKITVWESN